MVIGPSGEQLGIKNIKDALTLASYAGFDLVLMSPNAVPPVCKIMDYSKFKYENKKKQKENLKKQREKENAESEREKRMQNTILDIKKKFGKNAILKGMNLQEGATAKDRNNQIGGHKA